jgi:2-methylisocitrate lyase-like PEP mutase family enzyme
MASPVQKLRAMLGEKDNIIVCPGVFDGLTARIALNTGFQCLFMVSGQNIKYNTVPHTHL